MLYVLLHSASSTCYSPPLAVTLYKHVSETSCCIVLASCVTCNPFTCGVRAQFAGGSWAVVVHAQSLAVSAGAVEQCMQCVLRTAQQLKCAITVAQDVPAFLQLKCGFGLHARIGV